MVFYFLESIYMNKPRLTKPSYNRRIATSNSKTHIRIIYLSEQKIILNYTQSYTIDVKLS